jgi:HTH-type transcriptional regulator/antitoxin HipB
MKKHETSSVKKNETNHLTSFDTHLDELYGIRGTSTREAFEEEFETFKIGVLIQELRKENCLT